MQSAGDYGGTFMSAVVHYSNAADGTIPKRLLCGKKVKGGNEWTRYPWLVECSGCVKKLKETKPSPCGDSPAMTLKEARELAEQWKGRGDDCGRLARAMLALPEVGAIVAWQMCAAHQGQWFTFQPSFAQPMSVVCPICEQEAKRA